MHLVYKRTYTDREFARIVVNTWNRDNLDEVFPWTRACFMSKYIFSGFDKLYVEKVAIKRELSREEVEELLSLGGNK